MTLSNNISTDVKACMPLIFHNHGRLTCPAFRELFQTYCTAYGVIDHIQDSNSNSKAIDDPEWNRIDSIVKLWIFGCISQSDFRLILTENATTARQVWTILENLFREKRRTLLKNLLLNLNFGDGDSCVTDYCNRIKNYADILENLESPVSENNLVIYTINGLTPTPKFDYITNLIRHKSPLPSFLETRSMLLLEESTFLLLNHIIMLPRIFFKARIPSNLKAAHDFQVLGEGYQVLSNGVKGDTSYHKIGKSGVPDDTMIDHATVFGMLFGGDLFGDYIGQLYMASILEEVGQVPEMLKMKVSKGMRELQKKRVTELVTILKNQLQPFVKGQTTEFIDWATSEVRHLSQARFGEAMLHTIGNIYTRKAARELGKDKFCMVPFLAEWIKDFKHQMNSEFSAFRGYVSIMKIQRELKKLNNSKGKEENIMKVVGEKKDEMVNSLWQINVVDIETTLSRVCQVVLKDPTVSKDELKQRAIGMKNLGTILQGVKKQEGAQVYSASTSK